MPTKIRALLTLAVFTLAIVLWLFRDAIGLAASPYLMFGRVVFMCASVWLFPEFKKEDGTR